MDLDHLDAWLLQRILKKESISTWRLAKEYPWEGFDKNWGKNKITGFFMNKSSHIENRLKRMIKLKIVEIEINSEKKYVIDNSRVLIKKIKFDKFCDFLCIKDKDSGNWYALQI